ncbi:unnamed protein product [Phytophthora fragariaefolia]|uniref:Unnamed protein product n=1 Tax=Phytophthora fragariaefolia TaxID=1490495 RepID=A0A9W6TNC5_9STRA|nr:unnamed protein product [Phytophthora fragariaefolia]
MQQLQSNKIREAFCALPETGRMGKVGQRGKNAAIAAVARDIDFGHFWRQLKSAGWKAKRPSRLQTEWSYASPEGVHTFVGEDAVVAHALATGLLDENPYAASSGHDGDSAVEGEKGGLGGGRVSRSAVKGKKRVGGCASQSAVEMEEGGGVGSCVSQNAVMEMEGGGGGGRASRSAVKGKERGGGRASQRALEEEEGGGIRGSALQSAVVEMKGGGGGGRASQSGVVEEEACDVRVSQIDTSVQLSQNTLTLLFGTPSDAEPGLSPAAVTTAFDLSPSDLRLDASQRDADENTSEYESFSSGESDGVDFDGAYDEPELEVHDDNDVVLSDEGAIQMDEAFIKSLQVDNKTLDKEALKLREDALRATEWTPVPSDFETDRIAYSGLNMEQAQPVPQLRRLCDSPLLTFFYFLPKSMWVTINVETNRYAIQEVDRRARIIQTKQGGHRQESLKQIRRRLKAKPAYQTHEILHVIGLLIARMLCPQTQRFAGHWSMVEDGAVPAGDFGRFMGRIRCQDILRDLHFVDNQTDLTDYQRWMGGVDVHDQLRLQTYSLQTSTKFMKYYKSLFLGFADLAQVNAYILRKQTAKINGTLPMKRGEWYGVLQNQLLHLKAEDFAGVVVTPAPVSNKRKRTPVRITHALEQSDDWVTVSGVPKRRQRSCKVCAFLRTDRKKKSFATTFFCERCSVDDPKCWLCNKLRREYKGVPKTCFEIWHDYFEAGEAIPPTLGKRVVLRRPGQEVGKRKKTRRELQLHGCGDEGDDEAEVE